MEWPVLRDMLWKRLSNDDDEREDGDLVATRAELCAVLAWAQQFDRAAQPRRDEERETFDIIKRAAELVQPSEGEAVFNIRVGGDHTRISTKAVSIDPIRALTLAIDALEAERGEAKACPYHAAKAA